MHFVLQNFFEGDAISLTSLRRHISTRAGNATKVSLMHMYSRDILTLDQCAICRMRYFVVRRETETRLETNSIQRSPGPRQPASLAGAKLVSWPATRFTSAVQ
jgi:hypothetical protein